MTPACIVKFRPLSAWRIGSDTGARDHVDTVYHSDTLYSAVTGAMAELGSLDEWIAATAGSEAAAVRFSSCFPFQGDHLYVVPPRTHWPPAASTKVRWKGARFIPLSMAQALLEGRAPEEDRWALDGQSECLAPHGRGGPFRIGLRTAAAVDRMGSGVEPYRTACLEFNAGAGLWAIVAFVDEAAREQWSRRVQSALRLLADTGLGGERSRGWGRFEPEFVEGTLPELILPPKRVARVKPAPPIEAPAPEPPAPVESTPPVESPASSKDAKDAAVPAEAVSEEGSALMAATEPDRMPSEPEPPLPSEAAPDPGAAALIDAPDPLLHVAGSEPADEAAPGPRAYWLLSLFVPSSRDNVDWERGSYTLTARGGRIERSGEPKKLLDMVAEGSVVIAESDPAGAAVDLAPEGFPHPVYRAGFAVAIPIPRGTA